MADGAVAYAKQFVLLDTIVVKNADATLVAGSDYVATHAEDGTVTITILSEAAKEAETLKVASTSLKPDGVTAADIVGGVDALTGKETGLELVRQIYPRFGMTPGILLAPDGATTPPWRRPSRPRPRDQRNFDCVTYLDISTDPEEDGAEVYTDVKTAKGGPGRHLSPRGGPVAHGRGGRQGLLPVRHVCRPDGLHGRRQQRRAL